MDTICGVPAASTTTHPPIANIPFQNVLRTTLITLKLYLNSFYPVQPYFPRLLLRSPTKLSYTCISPLLLIQSTRNRYTIINSNICSFATPDQPTQPLPPDSVYSALPLHYGTSIIPACICLHIGRSNNPQLLVHLKFPNSASTADTIILCDQRPFYSCPPI